MTFYPPPLPPVYVRTNHTFHLLVSLFTCGIWLMVWPCVAIANAIGNSAKKGRYQRQMQEYQRFLWAQQHGAPRP